MPIVSLPARTILEKLGRVYSDEEFEELCFQYGLELDEITCEQELVAREKGQEKAKGYSAEKIYKVEVPANRYDILCIEGLTRALLIFKKEIAVPVYRKLAREPPVSLHVGSSTQLVRPFVVAAILRNVTLTEASFNSIIDLQEKLHQNICRKRSLVAIGTHDLDTIQEPFFYDAKPPTEIRFVPLNKDKVYNAAELMNLYSTDLHLKAYLPLIRDKPLYPVITDKNGIVLSMPPIINGQHSRLSVNTRNIFIEATATDLHKAEIVLDTLVTMFSEYCDPPFTVESVEVFQHDGSRHIFPRMCDRHEVVSINYVNRILGNEFSDAEVTDLLGRMGLEAKPVDCDQVSASGSPRSAGSGLLSVRIPPTRHDILHACDIVEDVAIAYGYDNIPESMPHTYCIAQSQPLNRLTDMVRAEIAQQGFTEALSFSLCSRDDISTKLRQDINTIPAVHISNPKTCDFQVVRTTLLPGILHTISNNRRLPLPLKVFEVQDIVVKDTSKDVGTRNNRRICAVYYSKQSGFEVIHGLLDRLMHVLSVRWTLDPEQPSSPLDSGDQSMVLSYELKAAEDPTYLTGRCADVILSPGNRIIGRLGVIHPEVLRNFELTMPCSSLDLDLEIFL
ncbi:Phenylalanyl-tRNA synthetase beta chain [Fasciola gigantica]|uniref:Phenylalanine--tRNA ligase beta subunit n=1 Tax=Fasciola gigantica TaxID=46835 RepID=A0A504Y8H5_FASGI|nr:Phenylalanyl-tRNA synthetase beta chain [Fasciola gigantica]